MANSLVIQSGGPTAVINSTVVGVVEAASQLDKGTQVFGALGGIEGLLHANFVSIHNLTSEELDLLRYTPGAALGTCRHKLTKQDLQQIIHNLREYHITKLYYIGGNGSMQVAIFLKEQAMEMGYPLRVIGLPKTVDNDLFGTDHTPGFASAAKHLATMVADLKMDVSSYASGERITVIETMGRHTGWLAGACQLAFLEDDGFNEFLIYLPEFRFDIESCKAKVDALLKKNKNVFIIIAEGVKDLEGNWLTSHNMKFDDLQRAKLGGAANYLKEQLEKAFLVQVRAIEPSIWQRSSTIIASQTDFDEAYEVGRQAVKYMNEGKTNVMVGMQRSKLSSYETEFYCTPLSWIASKEKIIPLIWYSLSQNKMTDDFIQYLLPLIQGEVTAKRKHGLPQYSSLYKLRAKGDEGNCQLSSVR
ncbi:diphosphate--fructose-6-phosphate 1-phosphotransferase [Lysinibacillus sp. NPDC098008]|uniref:diphosphate--fructose-6-phosphate 1-phosphotransferase n=1 Tax=Lysinibacillus sp. NPDC098008 TaxID=3364146 RepID=UPI00381ACD5A